MAFDTTDKPTFYRRAIDTFELPREKAEKIVGQMAALGVDRDDEYLMLFLATGRIELLVEALPESIRKAGTDVIGNLRATVADALKEQVNTLPAVLGSKAEGAFKEMAKTVAREAVDDMQKVSFRKERNHIGIALATFLVVLIGSNAWTHTITKDNVLAQVSELASFIKRPDWPVFRTIARYNDGRQLMSDSKCPVTGQAERSGGPICNLQGVKMGEGVQTSVGSDGLRVLWTEVGVVLGPIGLLLSGLGAGIGLGYWRGRKAKG